MARARALLVLFAAARATSLHAADYGPPAAASFAFTPPAAAAYRGFSSSAAASTAPSTVSKSVSSALAASSATTAVTRAFSSDVAAPGAVTRGLLGSALATVGVGGPAGGGGPFLRLGYGALAAFAGAAVMLTCAPLHDWDLVDEEREAEYSKRSNQRRRMLTYFPPAGRAPSARPPSAREVRAYTEMLRVISRQLKDLMKVQKERFMEMQKKHKDSFWDLLEDIIKKAKILLEAFSVLKEYYALISSTITGSILFYENYGDPIEYFVCPYSGYSEVVGVFLFSVKPKDETHQADGSSGGSPALQAKFCSDNKRLIHFSMCEVYGGSFLPKDNPLCKEPEFLGQPEHESPCIFAPIVKQRCYACAKQFIERLNFVEGAENDLEFSWIGPRMDFIRGFDGPSKGVPRVLACFNNENPARANGRIFNVRNPNSEEVAVRELAEMTEVYAAVSAQQFYGEGYDDSDERIPDMTLSNKQLGWNPMPTLKHLLEKMLTYKDAVKTQMSQASASS